MKSLPTEQIENLIQAAKRNRLSHIRIQSKEQSIKICLPLEGRTASTSSKEKPKANLSAPPLETIITSPLVGYFRSSDTSEGDEVHAGGVVCGIEALGLMNEVTSTVSGVIESVLVSDGDPVEFGQPLIRVGK